MNLLLTIALLMAYVINPKVYQFERALNTAVASYLSANGIIDPKLQRDNKTLDTPRAEIKCGWRGWGPNDPPHVWINNTDIPVTKIQDTQDGTLAVRVVTRRGEKCQDHDGWVGTVRSLLQNHYRDEITGRMEFHKLERLMDNGSQPEAVAPEHHDATVLSFHVRLRILFGTGPNELTPNTAIFQTIT